MVGSENSIFRKLKSVDQKKIPLTTEINFHLHFHFKVFPEKERERERARARGEDRAPVSLTIAGVLRAPVRADLTSSSPTTAIDALRDPAVDRDLANARSHRLEIATLIAILPSRDRAGEIVISDRHR